MTAGNSKEQSLFEAALQIEDVAARESFLNEACGSDAELRDEIVELLMAHSKTDRFFSPKVAEFIRQTVVPAGTTVCGTACEDEKNGTPIGRYKILRKLGEGGCGVVYLAEQQEPVRRCVALKVIKLGMDTRSVIARFEAERQALALMDHPNIAKVLDAGATENGRPFFVMEFVEGVRITDYCDARQLDATRRLQLFIQVCHAIQHAHQKGVIHRDIKPSNILVTENNDTPMPKVIDFGIAKATEGRLTDNTIFTAIGQFIGTPAYMSPEQAEMSGLDVDTRSDIYSLGILLYELLTGRTPFDQKKLLNSGFDKMRRTLIESEPQRPSALLTSLTYTDLTTAAHKRHIEPPKLITSVKGDLDWIVMKALEKDRARRYQTANGLAMDVDRYLNNEPVIARPPSQIYRLRKLIRRNKIAFASGTMVALSLITGLGVSTQLYLRERESLKVQEKLRQEAEKARTESEEARAKETQLRQRAEAREKITEARVLVLHGKMSEADNLLAQVPAKLFTPSMDATLAFRELGNWNVGQKRWKEAADRYSVLVQVNQVDKNDQTDETTRDLLMATPLLIEAGDFVGYDHIRKMELDRLADTKNLTAAEHLIKTSLLLPAGPAMMNKLVPLGKSLADSLNSNDPKFNDKSFFAAWRALALALLEYRQGNFVETTNWLEMCSKVSGQSQSCIAATHILQSMSLAQLGKHEESLAELKLGQEEIDQQYKKGLPWNDNVAGSIAGWLQARILQREAEKTEEDLQVVKP